MKEMKRHLDQERRIARPLCKSLGTLLIVVIVCCSMTWQGGEAASLSSISGRISSPKWRTKKGSTEVIDSMAAIPREESHSSLSDLLMCAIEEGDVSNLEWLLKNEVSPNLVGRSGRTPLIKAILKKDASAVDLLLRHGARVNETSEGLLHGHPLLMAIFVDSNDIFSLLLPHYENLDFCVGDYSPLSTAAFYGRSSFLARLLMSGADPNFEVDSKETALHKAVYVDDANHRDIARLLIFEGADVSHRDLEGRTPIDTAIFYGNKQLANILKADLR